MPEKLVGADGEVGVEKYFQAGFLSENNTLESTFGQNHSEVSKGRKRKLERLRSQQRQRADFE
jgi:hypothetical protein